MKKQEKTYEDARLLYLMARGDEAAFIGIYNRYWDKLYFLAHKHLRSAENSEEIVQDVFLNLWNKRSTVHIQSLPVYLAAMTRYAIYRFLARERKFSTIPLGGLREQELHHASEEINMDDRLLLHIIEELSNQLPEKCRLVFVHNKLMDQPLKQVAGELDISVKTAEAHLTKALKFVRGKLGDILSILLFP